MDHLQKFTNQVRNRLTILVLLGNCTLFLDWWIVEHFFHFTPNQLIASMVVVSILSMTLLPWLSTRYIIQPIALVWQAVLHIAPDATTNIPAPDLKKAHLGRELVTNLVSHVYQLASVVDNVENMSKSQAPDLKRNFVANSLPLPLVILDRNENVLFANAAFMQYMKLPEAEIFGHNIYSVIEMSFSTDETFDAWLKNAKSGKITSVHTWERVKLNLPNSRDTKMFDLTAYYNRDNPQHFETMLVLFDRTREYSQDEQAMSFVAVAVHELRTPLTLMRGYIEVFEEELAGKLDAEQTQFMHKLKDAAQQLATFTNNILNVARFDNDQLVLQLHEEKWPDILTNAVNDLKLRASLRGIELKTEIAQSLPTVGVDRVSIYEVVSNLIDNAIKYSGQSKEILIKTYLTRDGLVETTVQDFGVGIPEPATADIFEKFYRDYHHRAQIGGTGMGLYLCKGIVKAHGGNIWVRSTEGEGSTFGFTVVPYTQLADERKKGDNTDIVHTVHGWIKNHSMVRR